MADLPVQQSWEVEPDNLVHAKWCESQIQECVSRINRYKQDVEDLVKSKIPQIEGNIMMLEKKKKVLEEQLKKFRAVQI